VIPEYRVIPEFQVILVCLGFRLGRQDQQRQGILESLENQLHLEGLMIPEDL
jgi:hypothetical protein